MNKKLNVCPHCGRVLRILGDRPLVDLSVVIPVYDEEKVLPELYNRLKQILEKLGGSYEIIFIDDGSRDRSFEMLTGLSEKDKNIRILKLSRNFGHQIAITAGIDHVSGNVVIVMDADLQDPPEVIPKLVEKYREGYEVVYAIREKREGEAWFKLVTASVFYRMFRKLININMPLDTGDFRLLSRKAVKYFQTIREKDRFIRGLISWIGLKQTGITYERGKRYAGKTKFSFG